jgi:HD-GYP domain-containing protein (c-di-GMP phosphodiesterase class II)
VTILDIFEALTAKDRPYKKPIPVERSLDILRSMVREGSIDGEILALFIQSEAWKAIL